MKRCKVAFQSTGREIFVAQGMTVKEAINIARFDFDFPCGGRGKCGKCRIKVLAGMEPPTEMEKGHLETDEMTQGIRLACITAVNRDMVVELPYVRVPEHKILLTTTERDVNIEPHLQKIYVESPRPTMEDQRADWDRLKSSLAEKDARYRGYRIPLSVLRRLPKAMRDGKFKVTAVTDTESVLGVEEDDTTGTMLGVAFDIGTTTIVGYLMDLKTGRELGVASALNPQTQFGADVISRITYCHEPDGLNKLQDAVTAMLDRLVGEAVEKAGVSRNDVYAVTVVGNTCMHHLFLGIDPTNIALSPYVPVTGEPQTVTAAEMGISINPAGQIYVLPNIAGFVGADTVGVILATELDWSDRIKLAIDIGTNGEIVLGSREKLVACSAAAGPAFEGAQISSGMRGTTGAIDHMQIGDEVSYTTIGNAKPVGICGSGLIDAVAGMLARGIIDKRGRVLEGERVIKHEKANAFVLVDESQTEHGRPILVTQRDIRELQLAKGALSTGIKVLVEEFGIKITDISEVLLAGAFGNYLNPASACAIGLIPGELADRVRMVGNAAGTGAIAALLSGVEYKRAGMIADFVRYVELGAYHDFTNLFAGSMGFPEPESK
jgi:uncharacterized 2Fe-2S/4Fe-4S cluster protein (DUF4445 family)